MGESAPPGGTDSSAVETAACGGVGGGMGGGRRCPAPGSSAQGLPEPSSVQILPLIKGPDTVFEEIQKAKFICWDRITLRRMNLKAFHSKRSPGSFDGRL